MPRRRKTPKEPEAKEQEGGEPSNAPPPASLVQISASPVQIPASVQPDHASRPSSQWVPPSVERAMPTTTVGQPRATTGQSGGRPGGGGQGSWPGVAIAPRVAPGGGGSGRGAGSAPSPVTADIELSEQFLGSVAGISLQPAPAAAGSERQVKKVVSLKYVGAPTRPDFGGEGTPTYVIANHFKAVMKDPHKEIFHYDVTIKQLVKARLDKKGGTAPPAEPKWEAVAAKPACRLVLEAFKKIHRKVVPLLEAGYDGSKNLYAPGIISVAGDSFIVEIPEREGTPMPAGQERPPKQFDIQLRLVARTSLSPIVDFLSGRLQELPMNVIQALDVCLRDRAIKNGRVLLGSSIFSQNEFGATPLGDHVVAWKGFYQSIRLTQTGVIVNLDTSATAFTEECPAISLYNSIVGNRRITEEVRRKIRSRFAGLKVMTGHLGYPRSYRVKKVMERGTKQELFLDENQKQINVFDYFRKQYNITLQYPNLPCLEVGNGAKIPMELCTVLGGQKYNKKLTDNQTRQMLTVANQPPNIRCDDISRIAHHVHSEASKSFLDYFGLDIVPKPLRVQARELAPPKLVYKSTSVIPRNGQWNMLSVKLFNGCHVAHWGVVNFSYVSQDGSRQFAGWIQKRCIELGMRMDAPLFNEKVQMNDMEEALKTFERQSKARRTPLQLLVCIIPGRGKHPRYADIKKMGDTEIDIVTQCVMEDKTHKHDSQYLANVALKINVKCGGRNVLLESEARGQLKYVCEVPTIIFGADVTHSPPGSSSPSVAALVASQDWPQANKYTALVSAQDSREEIIQHLYQEGFDTRSGQTVDVGMVNVHLTSFEKATGKKPVRILFFRDGVSEGQFQQVLDEEIPALEKACSKFLDGRVVPRITFVVVQKRHHTRFFADDVRRRNYNTRPGTVVDRDVCHRTEFDFYLTSHAGIKGTSRPTKYHVLRDDNKFTADGLQTLVNNLCYTFARCTRSVSVVPPAYYAHLAAFRGRAYLSGEFSDTASNTSGSSDAYIKAQVNNFPTVKENVGRHMFFC